MNEYVTLKFENHAKGYKVSEVDSTWNETDRPTTARLLTQEQFSTIMMTLFNAKEISV